jgi:hypothetical protein
VAVRESADARLRLESEQTEWAAGVRSALEARASALAGALEQGVAESRTVLEGQREFCRIHESEHSEWEKQLRASAEAKVSELAAQVTKAADDSVARRDRLEADQRAWQGEVQASARAEIDRMVAQAQAAVSAGTAACESFKTEHYEWSVSLHSSADALLSEVKSAAGECREIRAQLKSDAVEHSEWLSEFRSSAESEGAALLSQIKGSAQRLETEQSEWVSHFRESTTSTVDAELEQLAAKVAELTRRSADAHATFMQNLEEETNAAKASRADLDSCVRSAKSAEDDRLRQFEEGIREAQNSCERLKREGAELQASVTERFDGFETDLKDKWGAIVREVDSELTLIRTAREACEDCVLEVRTIETQRAIEFEAATRYVSAVSLASDFP